jgi:hypothetical protein
MRRRKSGHITASHSSTLAAAQATEDECILLHYDRGQLVKDLCVLANGPLIRLAADYYGFAFE